VSYGTRFAASDTAGRQTSSNRVGSFRFVTDEPPTRNVLLGEVWV
jgi:hypothetical protein